MSHEMERFLFKIHYPRSPILIPYKVKFDSAFMYNGRPIQSFTKLSRFGYIYIFQDPMIRVEEESTILRDVASSMKDVEYCEDRKESPGVFAIISDLDRNPSDIYEQYKSR